MAATSALKLAWWGPSHGGLGWLRQRLTSSPDVEAVIAHQSATIELAEIAARSQRGVDRIVLSCDARISYPAAEVAWLQRNCPDIPWAMATSDWWHGARRTGIGHVDHHLWPWYRWWDTWSDWLARPAGWMLEPCWLPYSGIRVPPVATRPQASRGLIVANCRQLAASWSVAAQAMGCQTTTQSLAAFYADTATEPVDWVLWDDSCLDTSRGAAAEASGSDFFRHLRQRWPAALAIVAWSLPRLDGWQSLTAAGATEFLVKPSDGRALCNLLSSACAQPVKC